jgi:uncharacterized protein (UPF0216 family)
MKIAKYIEDLKELPEPRKTFMEIMKAHKSEVHVANILAYFFKSEEKHGLNKIFLEALLESNSYLLKNTNQVKANIEGDNENRLIENAFNLEGELFIKNKSSIEVKSYFNRLSRVQVEVEDLTDEKKRIDLILKTNECVVCIEFKINHVLDNPLEKYQNKIKKIESEYRKEGNDGRDLFFIVLTPNKKVPMNNVQKFINTPQDTESDESESKNLFRQVILSHFIKKVIEKIPNGYFNEHDSNLEAQYLKDFIQTIQNREVRFKRSEILKDLFNHIKYKHKSEYHSKGGYGGFIEIKTKNANYKIRFTNNRQVQLECWSKSNKFERTMATLPLSNSNDYNSIKKSLSELIE